MKVKNHQEKKLSIKCVDPNFTLIVAGKKKEIPSIKICNSPSPPPRMCALNNSSLIIHQAHFLENCLKYQNVTVNVKQFLQSKGLQSIHQATAVEQESAYTLKGTAPGATSAGERILYPSLLESRKQHLKATSEKNKQSLLAVQREGRRKLMFSQIGYTLWPGYFSLGCTTAFTGFSVFIS